MCSPRQRFRPLVSDSKSSTCRPSSSGATSATSRAGLVFSEKITTVSPGYAKEIVQPELGFGFEGVLARRSDDLVGILNGIDTSRWTPVADPFVPASFSAESFAGKRDAKRALLAAIGLSADDATMARPIVGWCPG